MAAVSSSTDTKLRCALAYRLEKSSGDESSLTRTSAFGIDDNDEESGLQMSSTSVSATCLAKLDFASDYETTGGALYGGRDKSYSDAVALVLSNDPPRPNASESNKLGGFKVVQSNVHQVVYGVDSEGVLCLAVIVGLQYPARTAIQCLVELYDEFNSKFQLQVPSATVNSLSSKAKPILKSICTKYSDATKVDKATALNEQVDAVKTTMTANIAGMLTNMEKSDDIAAQSEQLSEQAQVFKKKSSSLKKEMMCKDRKMTVILIAVVVGILLIIFVPLIIKAKRLTGN
jgi:hypothetical protein